MKKLFLAILILAAFAVLAPEAHAGLRHHRHHRHHVVRSYGYHHGGHHYRPHYYRPYVHSYPVHGYHHGGYGGVYVSGPRFSIGIGF